MQFIGPEDRWTRRKSKITARKEWHDWFAWHPVRIVGREFRWLETVERRLHPESVKYDILDDWQYRRKMET